MFLVKLKLSTAKKSKTTTFSRVFHPKKIDNFLRKSKLIFWTKNEDFEQCGSPFLKDLFFQRFNGLFAPHWRSDARGVIVGLTQYTRREHICRATLEAVAFQVYEILLAMEKDSGHRLKALLVDGGMTKNDLLMQIQADFNGNVQDL